jgi:DnaD/phage-associated family protein
MTKFHGFQSQSSPGTTVPGQFFSELLPQIDDLGELRVTLQVFRLLDRQEGAIRFFRRADLLADTLFAQSLGATRAAQEAALDRALAKSLERGTILAHEGQAVLALYFLNSPKGRAALEGLENGRWSPENLPERAAELRPEAPNIFSLYEANIGPLTPMLAERLRDAQDQFPEAWIRDAFGIAVENNVRKWRYIEAILKSWQEQGRDDGRHTGDSQEDRRKYVEGEFADFIEH